MTDHELLQAIGQVVESKMEPLREDICALKEDVQGLKEDVRVLKEDVQVLKEDVQGLKEDVQVLKEDVQGLKDSVQRLEVRVTDLEDKMTGVRVYIDTDLQRTLNLLLEGQQALWDRFVPREDFNALESRTLVLELAVKHHSQEIVELKRA